MSPIHIHWPEREIEGLFSGAERGRLRAQGDPLPVPEDGTLTAYRAVAGLAHELARPKGER